MQELVALGARYIKIRAGEKRPIGLWDAQETSDPLDGNNVALVTGNEFVVLDVEGPKKTSCADGTITLAGLIEANGDLPMTPCYSTPSGGRGYIFRQTGKVPFINLAKKFGLELRTGKHYNLIPPSVVGGVSYEWIETPTDCIESEGQIAEVPEWVLDWFTEQIETVTTEYESDGSETYERPDYLPLIQNNIDYIDPDCDYHTWWAVMAVCHRAGAYDVFVEWSKKGKKFIEGETEGVIAGQWSTLNQRKHHQTKLLGIRSFMSLITDPMTNLREAVLAAVSSEPTYDEENKKETNPTRPKEIPCSGLFRDISDEFARSVPEPRMYRYLCASAVLSTLAQRRIRVDKASAMSFHMLSGNSGSLKTVLMQATTNLLDLTELRMVMNRPASAQALQRKFSAQASQFLASDEAIQTLCHIYRGGRLANPVQTEMINLLLEYFGSPRKVAGQENKKHEESIKGSVEPRLTWILAGVSERCLELVNNQQFLDSGMASRLAPWLAEEVLETPDAWWGRETNGVDWHPETVLKLKRLYSATYFCPASEKPEFRVLALPSSMPDAFRKFYGEMEMRAAEDPLRASLWRRMRERALWYAGVHAWGCGREVLTGEDLSHGLALCEYHVECWDSLNSGEHSDDMSQCMDAILELGRKYKHVDKNIVHRHIASRFRGSENFQLRMRCFSLLIDAQQFKKVSPRYYKLTALKVVK